MADNDSFYNRDGSESDFSSFHSSDMASVYIEDDEDYEQNQSHLGSPQNRNLLEQLLKLQMLLYMGFIYLMGIRWKL